MRTTYSTAQVGKIIGIHANTVRLYEKLAFIPKAQRTANGYRVFTEYHIEQCKLARTALKVEVLQSGLRKKIIEIIKLSAQGEFQDAMLHTDAYIAHIKKEQSNAEEAIERIKGLMLGSSEQQQLSLTRKQAALYLDVTMDTLRNWELNGLFTAKRKENAYRVYSEEDINQLKIIRALRCANYSLASILRMLQACSYDPDINIKEVLNTPRKNDDIVSVCDQLITSLKEAEKNAQNMMTQLGNMNIKFNNTPL